VFALAIASISGKSFINFSDFFCFISFFVQWQPRFEWYKKKLLEYSWQEYYEYDERDGKIMKFNIIGVAIRVLS